MQITADTLRSLRGIGCLYAARSRDRRWIKIGFSSRLTKRLEALDFAYKQYAPFTPLGACRSSWRAEQQIHRALRPLHVPDCREIYPASDGVDLISDLIIENEHLQPLDFDDFCDLRAWSRQMSKAMRDRP